MVKRGENRSQNPKWHAKARLLDTLSRLDRRQSPYLQESQANGEWARRLPSIGAVAVSTELYSCTYDKEATE
jgi:hypothetical protein